jgi:hypothetical protein
MHSVNNDETNDMIKLLYVMVMVVVTEMKLMTRMIKNNRADNITLIRSNVEVKFPTYNGSLVDGDLVLHIT